MGKFKFIFLLILALFLVCGVVMVVDAPSSFDDSVSLIPTSDSSVDADSSNCENGACLVDSNKTEDNSAKETADEGSKSDKMNYDSKYYDGSYIDGLYFCNDLDQAFKDAKAYHRNVMIVFDGAACIYCEYLKEEGLTDPAVQKEINENDILLTTYTSDSPELAADILLTTYTSDSPELAAELDIHGTPTTVIFDEDGNELGRIVGYESPQQYLSELKDYNSR